MADLKADPAELISITLPLEQWLRVQVILAMYSVRIDSLIGTWGHDEEKMRGASVAVRNTLDTYNRALWLARGRTAEEHERIVAEGKKGL